MHDQTQLAALQIEAIGLHAALNTFIQHLQLIVEEKSLQASPSTGPDTWKRDDGRLSDKGISAMHQMFEANFTVTEVAKRFDITVSAASHRKRIWQTSDR